LGLLGLLDVFPWPLGSNGSEFSRLNSVNFGVSLGLALGVKLSIVGFSKLAIRRGGGLRNLRSGMLYR